METESPAPDSAAKKHAAPRRSSKTWKHRLHHALLLTHRYVGLTIALFLVVASVTGSISVFKNELDAWLNPALFQTALPAAGAKPLNPLVLREKVESQLPQGITIWEIPLTPPNPGRSVRFNLNWSGEHDEQPMDQAFADPYTGKLLGSRNHLFITESWRNLFPFIFRLHYSLGLDEVGAWLLGITAVLWTIDCFVALYLTFPRPLAAHANPATRRSWWSRWKPSWVVRAGSMFTAIFTFHRASGLWFWPLLLLLAWSSVGLLMMPVYRPITRLAFPSYDYDPFLPLDEPRHHPKITWAEAYDKCRAAMDREAKQRGFTIVRPFIFSHEPGFGFYRYQVESSLDPSSHWCDTVVWIDSDTGEFTDFYAPTGMESGSTFTIWLYYLHFGWVGGLGYRTLLFLSGVVTAILSVTGVLIWWRKRGRHVAA